MPQHYNSASRLLAIINAFLAHADGESGMDAWGAILGVEEPDGHVKPFKVAERLCALSDELDRLKKTLDERGTYEADLHFHPIAIARRAFSPGLLQNTIKEPKAWLAGEVKTQLRYMVPGIPSDESEFDAEDLDELKALIAALQNLVNQSELPERLLQMVRKHIALLLRGLELYPIHGPYALRRALTQVTGELVVNQPAIQEFQGSQEVNLMGKICQKAQEMTAIVSAASDYITVATLAYQAGKVNLSVAHS
ncbi:hypothetical protein GTP58_29845 [Duganella sp. CY15W]|uniref:hypothetical protein n=1 Tax=Duganella sp. CY15W TaxID=2692172 RepID=UPI00136DC9DD|nr:hypothetical protein [Duganella sp. CY15W]MYM32543.1 hypothetical protein [Duganella sp. CY15W]